MYQFTNYRVVVFRQTPAMFDTLLFYFSCFLTVSLATFTVDHHVVVGIIMPCSPKPHAIIVGTRVVFLLCVSPGSR